MSRLPTDLDRPVCGADIRKAYLDAGLSRRAFAREIGMSEFSVRRIEAGETVSPGTAKKLTDWLGCKVTDLESFAEELAS